MKADSASAAFAVIARAISAALFTSWITAVGGMYANGKYEGRDAKSRSVVQGRKRKPRGPSRRET
jgi:hypothetical protein